MSARSFKIHRPEIAGDPGPLELWDPENGYFIADGSFGLGAQTKRREFATSPWVHGRFVTAIVKDVQIATMNLQLLSPTENGLEAQIQEVLEALDQFQYHIEVNQHGLGTFEWVCESADYQLGPGGLIDDFDLTTFPYGVVITAQVPRSPVPVSGIL